MIWRLIFGTSMLVYVCTGGGQTQRPLGDDECNRHGVCLLGRFRNCISCDCFHGYTGGRCETDIDDCVGSPCLNQGHCIDGINDYTCNCMAGFTGKRCHVEIYECASNPCRNRGMCVDGVNTYTCFCAVGYAGHSCELNIECRSHPCMHGGTCTYVMQFNDYYCRCPPGFTGTYCQIGPSNAATSKIILETDKTVLEGTNTVQIPCFAEGIPIPYVIWETIDGKLPSNAKQVGHYLVFENVTMMDAGYYMCTASNEIGRDIKTFHLKVLAKMTKPHISPVTAPSIVHVNYYTDARLECHVTGFPTPSIMWSFNDNHLNSSNGVLIIHRVTNATVGMYRCIATNDAGSSQTNIYLKVTYDVPKIRSSSAPFVGLAGTSHNFTCHATGHPIPAITWRFAPLSHKSVPLPTHKTFKNGTVLQLVNMEESGQLWCTARNEFGMDEKSTLVIVKHPSHAAFG